MIIETLTTDAPLSLADRAKVARYRRARLRATLQVRQDAIPIEEDWRYWLATSLPTYVSAPFAPQHVRIWDWFTQLARGVVSPALIEIIGRGGGKSATVELATAWVQRRQSRRYVLFVSGTQEQADKHVSAIAGILEKLGVARAVNIYGHSKGWRRQELRTDDGFNVSGYGLDTAARGAKLDEARPDLMVFDDCDMRHDSDKTVQKKIEMITQNLIPAGSTDCAVVFVQNMIHRDAIAARLADGRADFLLHRKPVHVTPAVEGLEFERVLQEDGTIRYHITAGTPTWEGQNLFTCEAQLNSWGRLAFLREAQHRVQEAEHGLWQRDRDIEPFRVTTMPLLQKVGCGVDPSGTATGDAAGIVFAGVGSCTCRGPIPQRHAFVFDDRSFQGSPKAWAEKAVAGCSTHRATFIAAEKNYGGEMVKLTLQSVKGCPPVELVTAVQGKGERAEPVQKLYEEGVVHHVGALPELEDELCGWEPGDPSPNRMDALVHVLRKLMVTSHVVALPGGDHRSSAHAVGR